MLKYKNPETRGLPRSPVTGELRTCSVQTKCLCKTQMPPIMANFKDDKDQKTSILKPVERSCHKRAHMPYENSHIYHFEVMTDVILLKKVKYQNQQKDLITRNIHVKYLYSSTHCLKKLIVMLKFSKYRYQVKPQAQGHLSNHVGTQEKVLSQGIRM